MLRKRSGLLAILGLLALTSAAMAVLPGTSGTFKEHQARGVRVGVLECLNNTATATAGAATINAVGTTGPSACGIVTSEALTTAAGATYTLTLTNNMVAAADIVLASVQLGTATTGVPVVATVTPAAGSVVIVLQNIHASAAVNGTLKISYFLIKQSVQDSD